MKLGRNIMELATVIEENRGKKLDFVQSTKAMRLDAVGDGDKTQLRVIVDDVGEFTPRPLYINQVAERTGIPAKYASKMQIEAPRLLVDNVNYWFQNAPERRMTRALGSDARAFLSDSFARTDYEDVFEVAAPELAAAGAVYESCEVTDSRLYIKAFFPQLEREVKSARKGDIVRAGLMISTSEVGLGATAVTPWANFLVCTNGMRREGGYRKTHLGKRVEGAELSFLSQEAIRASDRADLLVLRDHIRAQLDPTRFESWIKSLEETTERKIEGDPAKGVEVLAKTLGLNDAERGSVLRHFITGGDVSQYGLINAVTRTAEDSPDYDRATELEAFGARVLDLTKTEWKQIAEAA